MRRAVIDVSEWDGQTVFANVIPEPNSGCWLWTGTVRHDGYGIARFFRNGKRTYARAHRLSYAVHVGPVPDNLHVCHKCDVPACVNPMHLFLGTDADNNEDCRQKGRSAYLREEIKKRQAEIARSISPEMKVRGETSGMAVLTDPGVMNIKRSYADGERISDIARRHGCGWTTVYNVVSGRTWRHIVVGDPA
jgi:hypothetical protein